MGQYYNAVVQLEKDEQPKVYGCVVNGEYMGAKLMEQAWWDAELVSAISKKIYKTKGRILWCGDYADDLDDSETLASPTSSAKSVPVYSEIWGDDVKERKLIYKNAFHIDCKFLCNHDTKEYVSMTRYYIHSKDKFDCCVHPLPLLTAKGNGMGGGDYWGTRMDMVGAWSWNLLSIEDKAPVGYNEIDVIFRENEEDSRIVLTK